MKLEITKEDFEAAVPAAREPKGQIYEVMIDSINAKVDEIGFNILGDPGTEVVENGEGYAADCLRHKVKRLACVSAFLEQMRGLDLVLTATGFGVVSTNDTAPASKMRVDSLEGELRKRELIIRSDIVAALFSVEGWSNTTQRRHNVETLFYYFNLLRLSAGITNPKPEDWDVNVPVMLEADSHLRKHIGNAYMDELLAQLTSHKLTEENIQVVVLCQKYIGACIAQNLRLKSEMYMRLINLLEDNLDKYPTYAGGEGYKLNHFEPYENHANDSAFHFVG